MVKANVALRRERERGATSVYLALMGHKMESQPGIKHDLVANHPRPRSSC